jgi:hypothetical protein
VLAWFPGERSEDSLISFWGNVGPPWSMRWLFVSGGPPALSAGLLLLVWEEVNLPPRRSGSLGHMVGHAFDP